MWGEQLVQRLGLIVIHQHLASSIAGENWWNDFGGEKTSIKSTLLGTNISLEKSILKMMFLFPRWDMLISWRVAICRFVYYLMDSGCWNLWWNSPIFSHFHVEIHTHSWQNRPVARVTFFFYIPISKTATCRPSRSVLVLVKKCNWRLVFQGKQQEQTCAMSRKYIDGYIIYRI